MRKLDFKKKSRFQKKRRDFIGKSIFQEKVEISRKSRDFKKSWYFKARETCRMLGRITSLELLGIDRVREAFRVTLAVTKVDSLLRAPSKWFPRCADRFMCFSRRRKISSQQVDHPRKNTPQDDPKLCPYQFTDSEYIILDPCRPTDS